MHLYKHLIFIVVSFFIISGCSDDKDLTDIDFNQTVWSGIYKEGKTNTEYEFTIWFQSDKVGNYRVVENGELGESFWFRYYLDGRILLISEAPGFLSGYWWIIKNKKNKIVLSSEPESPYESTLTLKRINP